MGSTRVHQHKLGAFRRARSTTPHKALRAIVGLAAASALSGCAATATLYPANDEARTVGVLTAKIVKAGIGAGPITINMPDGEVLTGRYSVNVTGSYGFGNIYGSVYGTGGYASGSAFGSFSSLAAGSPGEADVAGPKGTTMACEFYNNNYTGHGNGACRCSNGALYRLQY